VIPNTDRVNDLIEAKKDKTEFKAAAEASAATNVVNLTQVLQASLDDAKNKAAS
jgi:non-homologous end joining protein Ku